MQSVLFSMCLSVAVITTVQTVEVYDDFEEKPIEREAKFTSIPVNLMINEGETIKLPCFVERIEGYVLLWKFGETILSVGGKVTDSDGDRRSRIKLIEENNGNYLEIYGARESDGGEYMCQISDFILRDIRHSVIVRTKPVVKVERRRVQVVAGENVTLVCNVVSGNPSPELSWFKTGTDKVVYSDTLHLTRVSHDEAGQYTCRGDNGFSADDSVIVSLSVEHRPHIDRSEEWVHSSHGGNVSFSCRVSSNPTADLVCYNGTDVTDSDQVIKTSLLDNDEDSDVRNWIIEVDISEKCDIPYESNDICDNFYESKFTCVASNSMGKDQMIITLTNRPDRPIITSNENKTVFNVSVNSDTQVSSFKLNLVSNTETREIYVMESQLQHLDGTWTGVWIPESPLESSDFKLMVSAINKFGEGPSSDWFKVSASSTSGSEHLHSLIFIYIINLLVLFLNK